MLWQHLEWSRFLPIFALLNRVNIALELIVVILGKQSGQCDWGFTRRDSRLVKNTSRMPQDLKQLGSSPDCFEHVRSDCLEHVKTFRERMPMFVKTCYGMTNYTRWRAGTVIHPHASSVNKLLDQMMPPGTGFNILELRLYIDMIIHNLALW
jgi:hypothetical protein